MCSGPLTGKVLLFSLPLMASGILQLLFNAVGLVVVGKFVGSDAMAAVGSNGSIINLLVNLFVGMSIGASAVVARHYGAQSEQDVSETVHTAMVLSLISGILVMLVGFFLAEPILRLMGTPDSVLAMAAVYLKIYFLGMPGSMIYNFGAAILRGVGDTRRPLIYLTISGIINVILNLVLVVDFHLGVAGAAIATIVSEYISAGLVLFCMFRTNGCYQIIRKELCIHRDKLIDILRIGVPAGLQGAIFSISNVLIQSSINAFGDITMAGNAAAVSIEGFVYTCINSMAQAALTFTSQNVGARKWERLRSITIVCVGLVVGVGLLLGFAGWIFGRPLLGIYSSDEAVISMGMIRLSIVCASYALDGIMDVVADIVRGLGNSMLPMFVTLIGACGFRIVWIYTIFAWNHQLQVLYLSYPITWIITSITHVICYIIVKKRLLRREQAVL